MNHQFSIVRWRETGKNQILIRRDSMKTEMRKRTPPNGINKIQSNFLFITALSASGAATIKRKRTTNTNV